MKQEILNRIKALGGNVDNVKGLSLEKDLKSITFNSVLYPKPTDTAWSSKDEEEPIYGISQFVEDNETLLKSNENEFYRQMIETYYCNTTKAYGQMFFKNDLFTPFTEGTADYEEWKNNWDNLDLMNQIELKKIIKGDKLEFMFIAYSYGFPDNYFICLSDPNPENPRVYGTDHEVFFQEISNEGTLEDFFNNFITKEGLIDIVKKAMT